MTRVIKIEMKNTEFRRSWLLDRGGRLICLLSQLAMKKRTRLITNPTGPLPKSLLKLVGFFSILEVLLKMFISRN
jgi:hypothetical protein